MIGTLGSDTFAKRGRRRRVDFARDLVLKSEIAFTLLNIGQEECFDFEMGSIYFSGFLDSRDGDEEPYVSFKLSIDHAIKIIGRFRSINAIHSINSIYSINAIHSINSMH